MIFAYISAVLLAAILVYGTVRSYRTKPYTDYIERHSYPFEKMMRDLPEKEKTELDALIGDAAEAARRNSASSKKDTKLFRRKNAG